VASAVVFVTVLNAVPTIVLFAKGLPGLHRHSVVLNALVMLITIYPAAKYMGPVGGQVAALLAGTAGYVMQLIQIRGTTRLNLTRYGVKFIAPTLGSIAMLVVVVGGRALGLVTRPAADISLCVASCLAAYVLCASAHLRASKGQDRLFGSKTPESAAAR
jgi:hypothetical protein